MSHYFEAHVVIRLRESDRVESYVVLKQLAKREGFWVSEILHDESDEEKKSDLIFTSRDSRQVRLRERCQDFVATARPHGFITRIKIEEAVFDTKEGDTL